ncbi:hypothetical protein JCM3775_000457 [Rhodotorula graminis]|uniref:Uncharacterized protein n=1 Tax=Rhodotorula graminis (strain WP1) TaxID=578459 RepID=A0A194S9U5_RHOGW|nr:uncharacterized protein RHOBADRAFT_51335 [Rhodotorula graminis WP1]KPV77488.1 hypothetical protein RHOBADRAFT_51335 [Rhodotorula graminis WP1]
MARITRSAAKASPTVAAQVEAIHAKALDEHKSSSQRKKVEPTSVDTWRSDMGNVLDDDEVMASLSDIERDEVDTRARKTASSTPKSTPRKKAPSAPKKVARAPRLAPVRDAPGVEDSAAIAEQKDAVVARLDPKRAAKVARAVVVEVAEDEDVAMELLCGLMSSANITAGRSYLVYRCAGDDSDASDDDQHPIGDISDDDL